MRIFLFSILTFLSMTNLQANACDNPKPNKLPAMAIESAATKYMADIVRERNAFIKANIATLSLTLQDLKLKKKDRTEIDTCLATLTRTVDETTEKLSATLKDLSKAKHTLRDQHVSTEDMLKNPQIMKLARSYAEDLGFMTSIIAQGLEGIKKNLVLKAP
jgi:hypothetical protein